MTFTATLEFRALPKVGRQFAYPVMSVDLINPNFDINDLLSEVQKNESFKADREVFIEGGWDADRIWFCLKLEKQRFPHLKVTTLVYGYSEAGVTAETSSPGTVLHINRIVTVMTSEMLTQKGSVFRSTISGDHHLLTANDVVDAKLITPSAIFDTLASEHIAVAISPGCEVIDARASFFSPNPKLVSVINEARSTYVEKLQAGIVHALDNTPSMDLSFADIVGDASAAVADDPAYAREFLDILYRNTGAPRNGTVTIEELVKVFNPVVTRNILPEPNPVILDGGHSPGRDSFAADEIYKVGMKYMSLFGLQALSFYGELIKGGDAQDCSMDIASHNNLVNNMVVQGSADDGTELFADRDMIALIKNELHDLATRLDVPKIDFITNLNIAGRCDVRVAFLKENEDIGLLKYNKFDKPSWGSALLTGLTTNNRNAQRDIADFTKLLIDKQLNDTQMRF